VKLSVCIITLNEEANIGRTLKSVQPLVVNGQGEIIVVDSGSTDKTVEIAKSFGAKVFTEPWKGFAAQKNSAIDKAQGEWILSLDADEEVSPELEAAVREMFRLRATDPTFEYDEGNKYPKPSWDRFYPIAPADAYRIFRKNFFLDRWIKRGGFYPDPKLRLFLKEVARFKNQLVHETLETKEDRMASMRTPLLHHAYPTLSGYIEHMNKYSALGAEMEVERGRKGFSLINIVIRPWLTFIYNYIFRLGFLDGKEGLLLHLYHATYVSWKYAKVWELTRKHRSGTKMP